MTQKDLQELEQAARAIVAVVERNRVSDETAAGRGIRYLSAFRAASPWRPSSRR